MIDLGRLAPGDKKSAEVRLAPMKEGIKVVVQATKSLSVVQDPLDSLKYRLTLAVPEHGVYGTLEESVRFFREGDLVSPVQVPVRYTSVSRLQVEPARVVAVHSGEGEPVRGQLTVSLTDSPAPMQSLKVIHDLGSGFTTRVEPVSDSAWELDYEYEPTAEQNYWSGSLTLTAGGETATVPFVGARRKPSLETQP
jgi:hypothetical protein